MNMPKIKSKKHGNERLIIKLEKAIIRGNLSKVKSYFKKIDNSVNIRLCNDDTPLHIACSYGHDHIMRYLLKNGADCLIKNKKQELPLHCACTYALTGSNDGYIDLVLPLIKKCSVALDITNAKGISPRHLLEKFKERRQEESTTESSSSSEEDEENRWEKHIADEMQYEYEDEWGSFASSNYFMQNDDEPETLDEWSDRMAKEYHTKRHRESETTFERRRKEKAKHKKKEEEKMKHFQAKLEQEHNEYIKRMAAYSKKKKLKEQKDLFEKRSQELFSPATTEKSIKLKDIPWPFSKEDKLEDIKEFLLFDIDKDNIDQIKKRLKGLQINWHPDRFMQKCGSKLKGSHKEDIMEKVKEISQVINQIIDDLKE